MTHLEAIDRLHNALALAPYEGMEKARELVRIYPDLPSDVRHEHGQDAWAVLRDWNTWGGAFDTEFYMEALYTLLPYVSEAQTLELWKRAVSEWHSRDSERQYFAELSLVLIAKYMSVLLLRLWWQNVPSQDFHNDRARVEFLVVVGNRLPDYHLKLHTEAWKVASAYSHSEDWLCRITSELAHEVCWRQWITLIAQLKSSEPEDPRILYNLIAVLVYGIPEIGIQQACLDLCNLDSFYAYNRRKRVAAAIAHLIQRAPFEDEKTRLLGVVIDHLIEIGNKPFGICDPYVLAGELLCQLPEQLRGDHWSRLVKSLRK